jgi:uncharacterized membrane protein YqjE
LLHLQWQQEKRRLQWIMLCSVLSVSFVFLALLFTGFALLYLNKDNDYFALLIWVLPLCFSFMAIACFFAIQRLGHKGQSAFSTSCQEFIADIQLLRGQT